MSHRRVTSIVLFALVVAAACVPAASLGARTSARCATGTVAVTIDGARACRPARSVAPLRSRDSDATFAAKRMLGTGGVRFTMPKLRTGQPLRQIYTPAQAQRIVATVAALEATGLAAAVDAAAPRSRTARVLRARAARVNPPAGATVSAPVVTVGDRSASVSITGTVNDGAGSTTVVKLGLEARINDDGTATADVRIGTEKTDPTGVTAGNEFSANIIGKQADHCPRRTGRINYSEPHRTSSTDTISQQLGPINSGTITTTRSASANASGNGLMNVDATLLPIPFKVSATSTLAMRGNGLIGAVGGVLGSFYAMSATATGAGTINPKTGAIMGDARFDVRTSGTGTAQARALAAKLALDEARAMVGRQYAHFKGVEKRARAGDCTRMHFEPASGAALASGETKAVRASLHNRDDGGQVSNPVTWTVTPLRGKVTPITGTRNGIETRVTGTAPLAGTTASIRYKAVSRQGISTEIWKGVDSPFPKSYSGTMSYNTSFAGPTISSGAATVTYRLSESRTNPDGSKTGLYSVSAHRVTSSELTTTTVCTFIYGPVDPGDPQTLKAGDLEIQVSTDGAWTAGVLLDVDLGIKPGTTVCPPSVPPPPYNPGIKYFLQTRTPAAAMRPMSPNGPIEATGATDLMSFTGMTGTATWNLQPGA